MFLSSLSMADEMTVKYECTNKADESVVKFLVFTEIITAEDVVTQVSLATSEEIATCELNQELTFIIKVMEEGQFITHKNDIQVNPETVGKSSLEFNDELILKHKVELSVESCGADYSAENCQPSSEYLCSKVESVKPEVTEESDLVESIN